MYTVKTARIIEIAVEIFAEPTRLNVLLSAMVELSQILEDATDVNVEDLAVASWEVKSWPTESDGEHLVITIVRDSQRRIVRT